MISLVFKVVVDAHAILVLFLVMRQTPPAAMAGVTEKRAVAAAPSRAALNMVFTRVLPLIC